MAAAGNAAQAGSGGIQTKIPARLDRLPWTRFHLLVVVALGVTWVLDGLEVTIIGAISGILQDPGSLHLTATGIGTIGSIYIIGAVVGALGFGYLTDLFGRKVMFFITLSIYLLGVAGSALSVGFWTLALARAVTGLGIGGEYAAVNSAVDELMPARLRGRIGLFVNGSYWLGAAVGAALTLVILDRNLFGVDTGWRIGFGLGACLGLIILGMRRFVPESPRWLITHGYADQAKETMEQIESRVVGHPEGPKDDEEVLTVHPRRVFGFGLIIRTMLKKYRSRAVLCLVLMMTQAFLYNAILFTYALILTKFYGIGAGTAGAYLLPLAVVNFLGPVLMGPLFDSIGRRRMIAGTYGIAGIVLAGTSWMFYAGMLTSTTQTIAWMGTFFFASAAASSAYLTVSEVFPLETRAMAISLFYALGMAAGGVLGPWLFGTLIDTGLKGALFGGYLLAAALMLVAAVTEMLIGIDAEGQSLEKISEPLAADA